jgi:hypothetical protein
MQLVRLVRLLPAALGAGNRLGALRDRRMYPWLRRATLIIVRCSR